MTDPTTDRTLPKDPSMVTGLRLAKILPWLVYVYLLLEVIVLTLAFFLLLFNASTDADFTQWVYRSADRALEPFRGIFPSATADNGSVLDFAGALRHHRLRHPGHARPEA